MLDRKHTLMMPVLLFTLVFSIPSSGLAQETTGDYFYSIGNKFVRGVGHVLTSPADIPCTMTYEMREDPAAGFFSGLGKGTLLMLRRILVGATEIGTFMIPAERTIPPVCTTNRL